MSSYSIQIEENVRKSFFLIYLAQAVFLLLLLKSFTLSLVFAFIITAPFLIYLNPQLGFALGLTDYILLKVFFDFVNIDIPYPALLAYIALMAFGAVVYILKYTPHKKLEFGTLFWITIAIYLIMIFGLLYSSNRGYGIAKLAFFLVYNVPMLVVAVFHKDDIKGIEKIIGFAFLYGIILGLISFIIEADRMFAFLRFRPSESVNPIFLARSLGVSAVCGIYFFSRFKTLFTKLFVIVAMPVIISPIIWSGSRAPLLGLMGTLMLFYLLQPSQPKFRKIVISLLGLFAGIYVLVTFASQVTMRITTPVIEEASTALRFVAWFKSGQDFFASPFLGIGTGSFLLETPWFPIIYPHNLILEVACENGIIGLILISSFIGLTSIYGFKSLMRFIEKHDRLKVQLSIALVCIFAFSLWNAMFSGDISMNPMVWFSAGLIWALYASKQSGEISEQR